MTKLSARRWVTFWGVKHLLSCHGLAECDAHHIMKMTRSKNSRVKLLAYILTEVGGLGRQELTFARNRNKARASHTQSAELVDVHYCSIGARRAPPLDKFAKQYWEGVPYEVPGANVALEKTIDEVLTHRHCR